MQTRPAAQGPEEKLKLRIIKELEGNTHAHTHTYLGLAQLGHLCQPYLLVGVRDGRIRLPVGYILQGEERLLTTLSDNKVIPKKERKKDLET